MNFFVSASGSQVLGTFSQDLEMPQSSQNFARAWELWGTWEPFSQVLPVEVLGALGTPCWLLVYGR